jgi:glycosyltransferase involved in cell wall biosynthesis
MLVAQNMTKVGMFTEVFHPIVNGVVASIDTLRVALQRDGVNVTTFAPRMPACDDDDDASVVRFPSLPLPTATGYRLCVPLFRARDRERLRALDIVHAHSPFVSGWFAAAHARRMRIPLVFTYHTQFDAYAHYAPFDARIVRRALIALTRAFANRADVVIAPTDAMRERLRSFGVRTRIDVVPSGVDARRFANGRRSPAVRALLGAGERDRLVVVVARLGREKNVELAIDALAQCARDVRLAIVGAGPQRDALVARARSLRVGDRVRFAGALAPPAMPDVYASADALAFTSLTDTQGLVLAEALAARLPLVAADSAVAREIGAGRVRIAAAEPRAFAVALEAAARSIRPAADAEATARFDPERQSRAMQHIYAAAQSAVHLAL